MLVLVMDSFLMCIKYANPIVVLRSLLAGGPFMNRHGPSLLASRLHRQGMRCPGWPKAAASHYISEATLPLSFEQERNRHRVLRHTISCQIWDLAHTLTPVLFWNGATWLLCLSAAWFLWTARQLHHYWLHLLPVKLASRFLHQATLSLLMPLQIARWKSTPDCITSYLGHSTALKLYTNQSNYDYGHAGEVPASAEITYRACSPFIEDTCAQQKILRGHLSVHFFRLHVLAWIHLLGSKGILMLEKPSRKSCPDWPYSCFTVERCKMRFGNVVCWFQAESWTRTLPLCSGSKIQGIFGKAKTPKII